MWYSQKHIKICLISVFILLVFSTLNAGDTTRYYNRSGSLISIQVEMKAPFSYKEITFHRNGTVKSISYYKIAVVKQRRNTTITRLSMDSVYTLFHANGKVNYTVEVQNNEWHGKMITYNDSGRPARVDLYREHKFIGNLERYFVNGNKAIQLDWHNDSIIGAQSWDKEGNRITSTQVTNGNGVIVFCNENGTLCCSCDVINNKIKDCGPLSDSEDKKKRRTR